MKTLHWSTRLELMLAEPSALRVLDTASIIQLAKNVRGDISRPSVERWIQEAVAANRLQRVVRGLFLNRLIAPPAQLCEAAVWLRPGAVISLQTVLGDSGVWNNYTPWATAIVPVDYRRATPEAALLHWLYLSGSPRSKANLTSWRDRNIGQEALAKQRNQWQLTCSTPVYFIDAFRSAHEAASNVCL